MQMVDANGEEAGEVGDAGDDNVVGDEASLWCNSSVGWKYLW